MRQCANAASPTLCKCSQKRGVVAAHLHTLHEMFWKQSVLPEQFLFDFESMSGLDVIVHHKLYPHTL